MVTTKLETEGVTMAWMPGIFYDWLVGICTGGREAKLRQEMMDLAHISKGNSVLDVGCGTGSCAILAADEVGGTGQVVGIDATPSLLARARKKAAGKTNVRFEEALAESIPSADNSFEVVLCTFVMHHLPSDDLRNKVLAEMKRVLVPGGKLLIVDFPSGTHHGRHCHFCGDKETDIEKDPLVQQCIEAGFQDTKGQKVRMMGALAISAEAPTP